MRRHLDRSGKFTCTSSVAASGEIQFTAEVADSSGRTASAGIVDVGIERRRLDVPFGKLDRIDLLPEKETLRAKRKAASRCACRSARPMCW